MTPAYALTLVTVAILMRRFESMFNCLRTGKEAYGKLVFIIDCTVANLAKCTHGIDKANLDIIVKALEMAQIMLLLDVPEGAATMVKAAHKAIYYNFTTDMARDIVKRRMQNGGDIGTLSCLPSDIVLAISQTI
jgi:hypothetical protein